MQVRAPRCAIALILMADFLTVRHRPAVADEPTDKAQGETQELKLVEGKLKLRLPESWKKVEPRSRILAHEFRIPAPDAEREAEEGRLTMMSAGGSVEANIARWVDQFQTPEGKPIAEDARKVTKQEVDDATVHLVDLRGDFQDQPRGPFGPTVNKAGYRMLAAIIPTPNHGTWFVKLYGPQATIDAAEVGFQSMVNGIEIPGN